MRNARTIPLFLTVWATCAAAYEFLGPKWPGANPVVHYYVNEQGCEDVADEWDHIHRSFTVWTDVPTTAVECEYDGATAVRRVAADNKNVLFWADENWTLGSNVIGACYYWHRSGELVDFDIVFNARNFTWSTDGSPGTMDIGHISTHEVGHAIGLGHSDVRGAVMWPTAAYGDTSHRSLHADDSAGISALYPRTSTNNHPPVVTSEPVTEAIVGEKYEYAVAAEDQDGDEVRYRLLRSPTGMTIDSSSGLIVWYPKFLDAGTHQVVLEARDPMNGAGRQSFTIAVSDLIVYTSDTTVTVGDTILYPVFVTSVDDRGIVAGTIELSFDAARTAVADIDTTGTLLAGATLARNITAAAVTVAFAGPEPLSGEGVLFRLKLAPEGELCGNPAQLPLETIAFNDGDPTAVGRDGTIQVQCGGDYAYDLGGTVSLCGSGAGIGGVVVALEELGLVDTTTDEGAFLFEKAPRSAGGYTLTVRKDSGDVRDGVSAYDASLILRKMVGLHALDDYTHQGDAADVNGNGSLSAYDAALILRFLVGYEDATSIGAWVLDPEELSVPRHLEANTDLAAEAYLIGDVSGNWSRSDEGMPKARAARTATVLLSEFETADLRSEDGTLRGYSAVVGIEQAAADVYAGEVSLRVDGAKYRLHAVLARGLLEGYTSASKQSGDEVRIAFAGTEPLGTEGELFEVILVPADSTVVDGEGLADVTVTRVLHNENAMATRVARGPAAGGHGPAAVATGLRRIFPNPIRTAVTIELGLAAGMPLRLAVYDLAGREVRTLVDGNTSEGIHRVTWDTRDRWGRMVGSQTYLLRFSCEGRTRVRPLYVVR